eukprot:1533140-Prymnesium_polylepis.2
MAWVYITIWRARGGCWGAATAEQVERAEAVVETGGVGDSGGSAAVDPVMRTASAVTHGPWDEIVPIVNVEKKLLN